MEMLSLEQELRGNSYPGRGIVIGRSADGTKAVAAYFIMGRSENSRNRVFVEDGQGDIWVATPNNGIWRFTPQESGHYSGKMYDSNHDNSQSVGAMTLCVDSQNRIWAGTNGNGLDLYDPDTDRFVSVFDNCFEAGDVVFSTYAINKALCYKISVLCRHGNRCNFIYQFFMALSVLLQILYGNKLYAHFLSHGFKFRSPHHCAVLTHYFAAKTAFLKSCQATQINCGFSMAVSL